MKDTKTIASFLVFKLSRWFGTVPFDEKGDLCKKQAVYFACTTVVLSIVPVVLRSLHVIRYGIKDPSDSFYILKLFIAIPIQLSLIPPCIVHLFTCLTRSESFNFIFKSLPITSPSNYVQTIAIFVFAAHAHFLLIALVYLDPDYRLLGTSICCLSLYNFLVVLQCLSILVTTRAKIRTITRWVIRKKVYGNEFYCLLKIVKIVESLYQKQFLFMLAEIFGYVVTYLYYFIDGVLYRNYVTTSKGFLWFYGTVIYTRIFLLLLMTSGPHELITQAEEFNNELFKLMRGSKELCNDSKLVLYVTVRQTVNFTACGFFNLGYPLVTSIIAAATTYLVILIQFSMPKS